MFWSPGQEQTKMKHHPLKFILLTNASQDSYRWTVWLGWHPAEIVSVGPKGQLKSVRNRLQSARAKASLIGSSIIQDPKRKFGLANSYTSLMEVRNDKKVTPGITELSRLRAHMNIVINYYILSRSTARFATSMSALPILVVQKRPRVRVFTD